MTICDQFQRWLDAGMPERGSAAAGAHAQACASCATSLAAARELEQLLAGAVAAPPQFSERVMGRIEALERARTGEPQLAGSPLDWWVRAAAQPAAALAFVLAGLVTWKPSAFLAGGMAVVGSAGGWLSHAIQAGAGARPIAILSAPFEGLGPLARDQVMLGLALALAPAAAWMSWRMWRWFEARV